jgi:hypothetical protein
MDWEAESIRLSLFFARPLSDFPSLITTITGSEPTQVFERPKAARQEIAQGDLGHFFLTQEANRIVLVLGVPAQTGTEQTNFASLGSYENAKKVFSEPAKAMIRNQTDGVIRLGFAPALIAPVADRVEGYEVLSKLLPSITVDPQNSEDIFWQINRPRISEVIGGRFNRLSKWTVIQVRAMAIEFTGGANIAASPLAPARFAVRVELDMNTPHLEQPLRPDQLASIFEVLWASADEIASKGDIP